MKRTKPSRAVQRKIESYQIALNNLATRLAMAQKLGLSYGGDRKIYDALGYPTEKELDFKWFWEKYERQDIATAIIDRPVDKTWSGDFTIAIEGGNIEEDELSKAWLDLDKSFKVKQRLRKADKLAGIGRYSLILFGLNDVRNSDNWSTAVGKGAKKLVYLRQIPECDAKITQWETKTSNARFGLPKMYEITLNSNEDEDQGTPKTIKVHHTRVLHIKEGSLNSEVYGRPRLKPIVNRLMDLEKLLGGDAEMFWRGARPGYTALPQADYEMTTEAIDALHDELDKYEHDLRRFLTAKGVDIKSLDQQVADPLNHIDIQIQAIAAQTGIPKRILVGSERGELASSQDQDAFKELIQARQTEWAEPEIVQPFVEKCMELEILPQHEDWITVWPDVFAPSEKERAELGKTRASALKEFANSLATDLIPPELVPKYILGLVGEQASEVIEAMTKMIEEEEREAEEAEEVDALGLEQEQLPENGVPNESQT